MPPGITKIESTEFEYPLNDTGFDDAGFNLVYEPGSTTHRRLFSIKIHTDAGGGPVQRVRELPDREEPAQTWGNTGQGSNARSANTTRWG